LSISLVNFNLIYANLTSLIEQTFSSKSSASTPSSNTSVGFYYLNFSVSNDNVTFSSPPLTFIAYDSRLYTCSSTTKSCTKIGVNQDTKLKLIIKLNFEIFLKDNSSEETNTRNILIIIFVIIGAVLIASIFFGLFAFWRHKK
jgi:hypothetical protein